MIAWTPLKCSGNSWLCGASVSTAWPGAGVFCCLVDRIYCPFVRNVMVVPCETNLLCRIRWHWGNTQSSMPQCLCQHSPSQPTVVQFCNVASRHLKFQVMPSSSHHIINRLARERSSPHLEMCNRLQRTKQMVVSQNHSPSRQSLLWQQTSHCSHFITLSASLTLLPGKMNTQPSSYMSLFIFCAPNPNLFIYFALLAAGDIHILIVSSF